LATIGLCVKEYLHDGISAGTLFFPVYAFSSSTVPLLEKINLLKVG
jgi:hypothetical protein